MDKTFLLEKRKVLLVNFDYIFQFIQRKFLDDCHDYKLIKENKVLLSKSDCKKILFHHTIYEICEELVKNRLEGRRVLVVPAELSKSHEIFQYVDYFDFDKVYTPFIKRISNMLPIIMMMCKDSCISPFEKYTHKSEVTEFVNYLDSTIYDCENRDVSFQNIREFCEKYDLVFLTEEYFNRLRAKQLLY